MKIEWREGTVIAITDKLMGSYPVAKPVLFVGQNQVQRTVGDYPFKTRDLGDFSLFPKRPLVEVVSMRARIARILVEERIVSLT